VNIFVLDANPVEAAKAHCNKHVVKMVLESAQLLSTAHHQHKSDVVNDVYKQTHINHPSAIWARSTSANYDWLLSHHIALLDEYTYRYWRGHATARLLPFLRVNPCPIGDLTVPLVAMPDDLKPGDGYGWNDVVEAYRAYYARDKAGMLQYTRRDRPAWLGE